MYNCIYSKSNWIIVKNPNNNYFILPRFEGIIPGKFINLFIRPVLGSLWCFFSDFPKIKNISYLDLKYTKSPGTFSRCILRNLEKKIIKCRLRSGIQKYFTLDNVFFFGRVDNRYRKNIVKKKFSYLGRKTKSCVRGVAMNPVDHPHGGNTKTNKPEVSKWGWIAKHSK